MSKYKPSLQQIFISGWAETPALRLHVRARAPAPPAPPRRPRARVRERPRLNTPGLTPRPVRPCTLVTPAPPRPTRPHLKTRGSPPPRLTRLTRGSPSPPPPARADSPGACHPHTWGAWGLTTRSTCRSIQELHPVRTTTQICQTRDLIRSAVWPRCLSSWQEQCPPHAPLQTPSAQVLTVASAPWGTLSQE